MLPRPQRLADVDRTRFIDRHRQVPAEVVARVESILADVQADGDAALRHLSRELDGADLASPWLDPADWDRLAAACPADVQAAIRGNLARIEAFHARQVGAEDVFDVVPGVRLGRRPVPYERVACYVPGGRASYPSSVLMTVAPARLAGVADIVVVTPPRTDGSIDPAVAYAARAAGATRILLAGGAQAVAAVAYGTGSVPRVDAIVGPGNAYVTAAKQRVAGVVWTDAPAGPSELLVLADGDADPAPIAWDLIAQAEHDPDAQVVLITDSAALADAVADLLPDLVAAADRSDIIAASLRDHGALLVADTFDDAVAFADAYAAEHLELHTRDPRATFARIRNAGSVFLGPWAPVPLGDYGSGTNHVLPTMGLARIRGGLSVDDFRKWITWQEVDRDGLAALAPDVATLARAEGLTGHAQAIERRLA